MTLQHRTLPEQRRGKLKQQIQQGHLVRALESHNGISGIIADTVKVEGTEGSQEVVFEFDAIWESSLTDSAGKGHPDIEVISFDSRLHTINEILAVTHKPMIVDGDTGGDPNNFEYMVSKLERAGVSVVIVEDKVFPKRNSLEAGANQTLEDPHVFAHKIKRGKAVQMTDDFMIIARLESLIAGTGMRDALKRAEIYLEAGVDGIMIHSKSKDPAEILEFAHHYRELKKRLGIERPLVCVPTTYNSIQEEELKAAGFNVVIYANHLLRAAYKAMIQTAKTILSNQRCLEADALCAPVKDIFATVGFLEVKEKDKQSESNTNIPVIIPAAGDAPSMGTVAADRPRSMLDIAGKTLLDRQIKALNVNGLNDITVVTGFQKEQMKSESVRFIDNADYRQGSEVHSLLRAREYMTNGFIMLYSDILVEFGIIDKLLDRKEDIVLVVDNSIQYHEPVPGKVHDFVVSANRRQQSRRNINFDFQNTVSKIGKRIAPELATHEFVGLARFSPTGVDQLIQTFEDCVENFQGKVQEAENMSKFRFTDLIQEMIDRGFNVHYLEIHKGWLEVHLPEDIELANELFPHQNPSQLATS
ncbi:MAG: phosphoenolpyruvate mutase [Nitrospina sp.]|nr:phosphoenolpyruvate mutase [Nitrospina sp.]